MKHRFDILTLFPVMFQGFLSSGIIGKALNQYFSCFFWNPWDYKSPHEHRVDDRPFGGGPGQVMKAGPLAKALTEVLLTQKNEGFSKSFVIYLSPQGEPASQKLLEKLARYSSLTLVCGRYEGVDERFLLKYVDQEISVGDFVVSGGELPAMMLLDGIVRLIPGVLGNQASYQRDSFSAGLLNGPQYTRPALFEGLSVPSVLLSGHHHHIHRWRMFSSLMRTKERRPDLWKKYVLTEQERACLASFGVNLSPES